MATRDILYLIIDKFLHGVVIKEFSLLLVGWYLFRVLSGKRYLPRDSNENALCIMIIDNVFVA